MRLKRSLQICGMMPSWPSSPRPIIVYDLPAPVCPYANMHMLYPENVSQLGEVFVTDSTIRNEEIYSIILLRFFLFTKNCKQNLQFLVKKLNHFHIDYGSLRITDHILRQYSNTTVWYKNAITKIFNEFKDNITRVSRQYFMKNPFFIHFTL
jgi:hypothetical protein